MSSPEPAEPVSYVKLLREIRDRIGEEIADMTIEERLRWHESQEVAQSWRSCSRGPRSPRGLLAQHDRWTMSDPTASSVRRCVAANERDGQL